MTFPLSLSTLESFRTSKEVWKHQVVKVCEEVGNVQSPIVLRSQGEEETELTYYVTLISLLLSPYATDMSRGPLLYLLSLLVEKVPVHYVRQSSGHLLRHTWTLVRSTPPPAFMFESSQPEALDACLETLKRLFTLATEQGPFCALAKLALGQTFSGLKLKQGKHVLNEAVIRLVASRSDLPPNLVQALTKSLTDEDRMTLIKQIMQGKETATSKLTHAASVMLGWQLSSSAYIPQLLELGAFLSGKVHDMHYVGAWFSYIFGLLSVSMQKDAEAALPLVQREWHRVLKAVLLQEDTRVSQAAGTLLASHIARLALDPAMGQQASARLSVLDSFGAFLEACFDWQYEPHLGTILDLLHTYVMLVPRTTRLASLLAKLDAILMEEGNDMMEAAKKVIASVYESHETGALLSMLPLAFDCDRPRLYLLSIMLSSKKVTSLAYFQSALLPLLETVWTRYEQIKAQQPEASPAELADWTARAYMLVQLLGVFVQTGSDVEALGPLLETVWPLMKSDQEAFAIVCKALMARADALLGLSFDELSLDERSKVEHEKKLLGQRSGPVLTLLYETIMSDDGSSQKGSKTPFWLTCIAVMFRLAPLDTLHGSLSHLVRGLLALQHQSGLSAPQLKAQLLHYLDMLLVLAPFLNQEEHVVGLLKLFATFVQKEDVAVRKKCYRGLAALLAQPAALPMARDLIALALSRPESFKSYYALLLAVIQGPAFACLQTDVWPGLLGQLALGMRESGEACRNLVMACWDALLLRLSESTSDGPVILASEAHAPALLQLLHALMAGLAAKTSLGLASTLTVLAHILDAPLMQQFLAGRPHADFLVPFDNVLGTLGTGLAHEDAPLPDWTKAYLDALKVMLITYAPALYLPAPTLLAARLQTLLSAMKRMSSAGRLQLRHFLERCIRLYGADAVRAAFGPEDARLWSYIRKSMQNKKNREHRQTSADAGADKAGYGSDRESEADDESDDEAAGNEPMLRTSLKDEVDLLSLAPVDKAKKRTVRSSVFVERDGKLVLRASDGEDDAADGMALDAATPGVEGDEERFMRLAMSKTEEDLDAGDDGDATAASTKGSFGKMGLTLKAKQRKVRGGVFLDPAFSGALYKARKAKAKGDAVSAAKTRSTLEPFAYVPLHRKLLASHTSRVHKRKLFHHK